MYKNQIAFAI